MKRHDFTPDQFPLTLRIYSGATGEELWSRTVTLDEARGPAVVAIPGYASTQHAPVRVTVTCANGETEDA